MSDPSEFEKPIERAGAPSFSLGEVGMSRLDELVLPRVDRRDLLSNGMKRNDKETEMSKKGEEQDEGKAKR